MRPHAHDTANPSMTVSRSEDRTSSAYQDGTFLLPLETQPLSVESLDIHNTELDNGQRNGGKEKDHSLEVMGKKGRGTNQINAINNE